MANYTSVVASNICDAAGNKLASGTVSFQATDAGNQPINFQVGGGGQVVTTPATAAITAGVIAGGFQVADSANTSPAGIVYRVTITDTTLNRAVVMYSLVAVTGATFNLDNYTPPAASVLSPTGVSVNGPLTVTGNLSVTGSFNPGTLGNVTSTGAILAKSIGGVQYADQFPGATADAKIAAAATALPSAGGIIDCSGLTGAQTFVSDPLPNGKPITLHLANATYSYDPTTMAFTLPSNARLILDNATIISSRSDGMGVSTPNILVGMVSSRAYQVTGSISNGQNTLTVSNAANATLGAVVAVVGAWGGMNGNNGLGTQSTTINAGGGMGAGDTSVTVTNTAGFNAGSDIVGPYLLIDNEIIGYTGTTGTTFTGLTRGRFGTTATTHANSSTVYQLGSMVSQIIGISGNVLTLQDNASFTVTNTSVVIGSTHVSIEGSGTIDGNYTNRANPQPSPVYAVALPFASMSYVGPNITMQNFPVHTLFNFQGWRNEIHGIYRYGGRPSVGLGVDVAISGKYNKVSTTSHENGNFMVLLDDRTSASGIFDGPASYNIVDLGPQVGGVQYNEAIGIEGGSSNNYIKAGNLSCNTVQVNGAVYITSSNQWTVDPVSSGNRIDIASLNETGGGGSLSILLNASGNIIYSGKVTGNGAVQVVANNQVIYVDSNNALNFSSGLVNALAFRRSTGNTGFPDICGDGTNALVIAGKGDGSGTVKVGTTTTLEIGGSAKIQGPGGAAIPISAASFTRSAGNAGFPDIVGDGTNALVIGGKSDGSGSVAFGTTTAVSVTGGLRTNTEVLTAAAPTVSAGQVGLGATHATTVGAAGGATAPPATPLGYLIANVDGTQVKIPYYSN